MPTPDDDDEESPSKILDPPGDLLPAEDDPLLNPDAWADDEEDPATAMLLREPTAVPTLPALDPRWDDDEEADDLPSMDDDLLDTEHDLDFRVESVAEEALPILPLALEIEIEGERVPARVDLSLPRSRWVDPARSEPGDRTVTLRIRGRELAASVACEPGAAASVWLGLDVLHARFLIRP